MCVEDDDHRLTVTECILLLSYFNSVLSSKTLRCRDLNKNNTKASPAALALMGRAEHGKKGSGVVVSGEVGILLIYAPNFF